MIVKDVMEEIAEIIRGIGPLEGRTYGYPPGSVRPPAAVVAYPETYTYDFTGRRGADRMTLPVVLVIGKPTDRGARDAMSGYVSGSGATSLKEVLEAADPTSFHTLRVMEATFDVVTIGGTDYLAAMLDLDIVGSGG